MYNSKKRVGSCKQIYNLESHDFWHCTCISVATCCNSHKICEELLQAFKSAYTTAVDKRLGLFTVYKLSSPPGQSLSLFLCHEVTTCTL